MDFSQFTELNTTAIELQQTRVAVDGVNAVKRARETYLPRPATITYTDSARIAQQNREYAKYLLNAEFEDYTAQTMSVMLGKLDLHSANINNLDSRLEYLLSNSDGDGLSLFSGFLGDVASNVMQAKWHIAIADYQGLPDVDIQNLSIAEVNQIKSLARVKFKSYTRESLVKYSKRAVNGVDQIDYMMLSSTELILNKKTGTRDSITSYIVLALDDDGNYYQKKYITTAVGSNASTGTMQESEPVYLLVGGKPLKFIPCWIFADEELRAGEFPLQLGYLSKIAEICMQRYRQSAEMKDFMSRIAPTVFIGLDDSFTIDKLEELNGRRQFELGGINAVTGGSIGVAEASIANSLQPFFDLRAESKQTLKDYGAHIPDSSSHETATKSRIDASQQNAVLNPIIDSLEEGLRALISYAAMFEGIIPAESVDKYKSDVEVVINRELDIAQPTAMELTQFATGASMLRESGLMTDDIAIEYLIERGCYPRDETLASVKNKLGISE